MSSESSANAAVRLIIELRGLKQDMAGVVPGAQVRNFLSVSTAPASSDGPGGGVNELERDNWRPQSAPEPAFPPAEFVVDSSNPQAHNGSNGRTAGIRATIDSPVTNAERVIQQTNLVPPNVDSAAADFSSVVADETRGSNSLHLLSLGADFDGRNDPGTDGASEMGQHATAQHAELELLDPASLVDNTDEIEPSTAYVQMPAGSLDQAIESVPQARSTPPLEATPPNGMTPPIRAEAGDSAFFSGFANDPQGVPPNSWQAVRPSTDTSFGQRLSESSRTQSSRTQSSSATANGATVAGPKGTIEAKARGIVPSEAAAGTAAEIARRSQRLVAPNKVDVDQVQSADVESLGLAEPRVDSRLKLLIFGLLTLVSFLAVCLWLIVSSRTDSASQNAVSEPVVIADYVLREEPIAVPGIIQAEDYDAGGEGIAYQDSDGVNSGDVYRTDGVDISAVPNQGEKLIVSGTEAGEWLKYTIEVAVPGTYEITTGVSNSTGELGSLEVSVDSMRIGTFYGEQGSTEYEFDTQYLGEVDLEEGIHELRLDWAGGGGISVDWVEIARS